jgi:hypothetical protein
MRLIDADQLKASIEKKDRYNLGGEKRIIVCGMLDDAPTIEAEPVKHGRWLPHKITASSKCSLCRRVFADETPYCPNCGAKMDGGEKK